jgi:hypothetical protein
MVAAAGAGAALPLGAAWVEALALEGSGVVVLLGIKYFFKN